jgi:hypothetical protein
MKVVDDEEMGMRGRWRCPFLAATMLVSMSDEAL